MRVLVENFYSDKTKIFEGSVEQVVEEILINYPYLRSPYPEDNTIESLVEELDHNQGTSAEILDQDELNKTERQSQQPVGPDSSIVRDMVGYNYKLHEAFEGAGFLSCKNTPTLDNTRKAFWEQDGCPYKTALVAHGLDPSEENLRALHAILGLSGLKKNEEDAVSCKSVVAAFSEGQEIADLVGRAFKDRFVVSVKLNGKHASGILLARDEETNKTLLLKPGSGYQSIAAGADQEKSGQSRREVCFYHIGDKVGLGNFFVETELLLIDLGEGSKEYAAMALLPWDWKTIDYKRDHGVDPRQILGGYLADGRLHKLAALMWILGSPDEHANQIMVSPDDKQIVCIDHGSAFCSSDFRPATDHNSFIPFILRAWSSPAVSFNALDAEEKLKKMPGLNSSKALVLKEWVSGLDSAAIGSIIVRYGIDQAPSLDRLAKMKGMVLEQPADVVVNRLWAGV